MLQLGVGCGTLAAIFLSSHCLELGGEIHVSATSTPWGYNPLYILDRKLT